MGPPAFVLYLYSQRLHVLPDRFDFRFPLHPVDHICFLDLPLHFGHVDLLRLDLLYLELLHLSRLYLDFSRLDSLHLDSPHLEL